MGDIVAIPHRGLFTGNRGIIHDPATKTLLKKRWSTPAWLICVCEFRGRRRKVMGGRSWTELFFLDEATAFAAGHRPCFYCRRDDANRFRAAGKRAMALPTCSRRDIDAVLHRERLASGKKRCIRCRCRWSNSRWRDGAAGDESFLIVKGRALRWTLAGYRKAEARDRRTPCCLRRHRRCGRCVRDIGRCCIRARGSVSSALHPACGRRDREAMRMTSALADD